MHLASGVAMSNYTNEINNFEYEELSENSEDYSVEQDDFSGLHIIPSDWTVATIRDQIGKELDIDPDFQRRNVWTKIAKSRFIESLFLGIPIPQILLADDTSGRFSYIVLDGKQRLITIKEFFNNRFEDDTEFRLSGLLTLKQYNKKNWNELRSDLSAKRIIEKTTIRTAVLKNWTHDKVLYEIFHRLNSGATKLSPMELRMVLKRGPFLKYINKWTELPQGIHKLLKVTAPDTRMKDVELTIRHLAFNNQAVRYKGNLKDFLDRTCDLYNQNFNQVELDNELAEFSKAISAGQNLFGRNHFCRKWIQEKSQYDSRFNRAIFDIQVSAFRNSEFRNWATANKVQVIKQFHELCRNPEFVRSLETTTKSISATKKRYSDWFSALQNLSNVTLTMPNIVSR